MADRWPIPVKHLTGEKALTIICQRCETEAVIGPDEILCDGLYACPADHEKGERECGGSAVVKYEQADVCPGCGKLGYFGGLNDPLKGACSRRCMLQVEYARGLAA